MSTVISLKPYIILFLVKAKKENKVVNFGFEMSECFKRSNELPVIVEHKENDVESVHEIKELLVQMTKFHDEERVHIQTVKETLSRILCRLFSL